MRPSIRWNGASKTTTQKQHAFALIYLFVTIQCRQPPFSITFATIHISLCFLESAQMLLLLETYYYDVVFQQWLLWFLEESVLCPCARIHSYAAFLPSHHRPFVRCSKVLSFKYTFFLAKSSAVSRTTFAKSLINQLKNCTLCCPLSLRDYTDQPPLSHHSSYLL